MKIISTSLDPNNVFIGVADDLSLWYYNPCDASWYPMHVAVRRELPRKKKLLTRARKRK